MRRGTASALEEVYIGSEEVFFASVSGGFEAFRRESCSVDPSPVAALEHATSKAVPLLCNDENGVQTPVSMLFDCVPALKITGGLKSEEEAPIGLALPLIKVPAGHGATVGIRSGGRSAILSCDIVEADGKTAKVWYRLKGCGNFVDHEGMRFPFPGLPVREVTVFGEVIGSEMRGCSFPFSSLRELYMTDVLHIASHSRKEWATQYGPVEPTTIGNSSIGLWNYRLGKGDIPEGLTSAMGEVVTTPISCTLFETKGEKRLEAHLVQGLCTLIEEGLLVCDDQKLTLSTLQGRQRKNGGDCPAPPETWAACCSGEDPCAPLDFSSTATAPAETLLHIDNTPTGVRKAPAFVPVRMRALWESSWEVAEAESDQCKEAGLSLAGKLAWRLGWECGDFSRLLQDSDVVWGYFFDHNPFEPHCNSHSNNFIVVPPKGQPPKGALSRFLAPCDFDMAYLREHFISPYTSAPDDDLFDSWKDTEAVELARSLGGESANSGVAISPEESQSEAGYRKPTDALQFSLRDTMLDGYYNGLAGSGSGHRAWEGPNSGMQALITLSLICTHLHQS